MAKPKAPLFALGASGTIGKTIVFSEWQGIPYVRTYAIPKNPNTPAQQAWRTLWKTLCHEWQYGTYNYNMRHMHNAEVEFRRLPMSGFNLFIQNYLHHDPDTWNFWNNWGIQIQGGPTHWNYVLALFSGEPSTQYLWNIFDSYNTLYRNGIITTDINGDFTDTLFSLDTAEGELPVEGSDSIEFVLSTLYMSSGRHELIYET